MRAQLETLSSYHPYSVPVFSLILHLFRRLTLALIFTYSAICIPQLNSHPPPPVFRHYIYLFQLFSFAEKVTYSAVCFSYLPIPDHPIPDLPIPPLYSWINYSAGGGHVRRVQSIFNLNETARVRSSGQAPTLVTTYLPLVRSL